MFLYPNLLILVSFATIDVLFAFTPLGFSQISFTARLTCGLH